MNRPANIKFLTVEENLCMEYLLLAQDMFDKICANDPQSGADSYNFGHYVDAARNSILIRGSRRMDPENLLMRSSGTSAAKITPTMQETARSTEVAETGGSCDSDGVREAHQNGESVAAKPEV